MRMPRSYYIAMIEQIIEEYSEEYDDRWLDVAVSDVQRRFLERSRLPPTQFVINFMTSYILSIFQRDFRIFHHQEDRYENVLHPRNEVLNEDYLDEYSIILFNDE